MAISFVLAGIKGTDLISITDYHQLVATFCNKTFLAVAKVSRRAQVYNRLRLSILVNCHHRYGYLLSFHFSQEEADL